MRILISEEALQTGKGHWPSYIGCIADGLRAAGDNVEVLVHQLAPEKLLNRIGGVPWFSRNCWLDPRSQGGVGGLRHNFRFLRELKSWLVKEDPYDWVCALTMRLQHLLAFALISRDRSIPEETRFLLLFVQGFGKYTGPSSPTVFPLNASTVVARFCFWLMGGAVRSGRVVLAAETQGMQEELQRLCGLPVALFPHPVPAPPEVEGSERGLGSVITITCPGFARHEKGNDLLQDAIAAIIGEPGSDRMKFVMQWPEPFALPDGRLLTVDPRLAKDSRVRLVNESLGGDAYEALLSESDFVILPYRRNSYHHRVSRVAIEAASRGIPMIYTTGTWTAEIAELAGCGVCIAEEAPESVAKAIRDGVSQAEKLRNLARAGAEKVSRFHSVATLRENLLREPTNPVT
jgi:glycosyltransferase involved in cell wall biosynthesis